MLVIGYIGTGSRESDVFSGSPGRQKAYPIVRRPSQSAWDRSPLALQPWPLRARLRRFLPVRRLQRACRRAFRAASASELPTSALMAWARSRGAIQVWQREEVCRAAKRWAVRVRREGREWVWRLRDGQPLGEDEMAEGDVAQISVSSCAGLACLERARSKSPVHWTSSDCFSVPSSVIFVI
jgi:hypothetical protein